jgi:hypothetical protein
MKNFRPNPSKRTIPKLVHTGLPNHPRSHPLGDFTPISSISHFRQTKLTHFTLWPLWKKKRVKKLENEASIIFNFEIGQGTP